MSLVPLSKAIFQMPLSRSLAPCSCNEGGDVGLTGASEYLSCSLGGSLTLRISPGAEKWLLRLGTRPCPGKLSLPEQRGQGPVGSSVEQHVLPVPLAGVLLGFGIAPLAGVNQPPRNGRCCCRSETERGRWCWHLAL